MLNSVLRRISFLLLLVPTLLPVAQSVAAQDQILPQIVVGGPSNENYGTIIFFANSSTSMASGTGELFRPDGTPLRALINGGGPSATFQWSVAPMGTTRVTLTSSSSRVEAGWLKLTVADRVTVTASATVQLFDEDSLISEAGVFSSPRLFSGAFVHDSLGPQTETAITVANPNNTGNTLTLTLFNRNGQRRATTNRTLQANACLSRFVTELFSDVQGVDEMEGRVEITGTLPFAATALYFSGRVFSALPIAPGPIERYGFEDGTAQGWMIQTFETAQAIRECTATDELAYVGRLSLRCTVDLMCGSADKSNGETFVDLRTNPPSMDVMAPLNLDGVKITAWVYAPPGAAGERQQPNGFQLFVKDINFRSFFGSFTNIQEGNWMMITATPGRTAPPGGFVDSGFDPTQIIIVGVKIGCGGQSRAAFRGPIYIDAVAW